MECYKITYETITFICNTYHQHPSPSPSSPYLQPRPLPHNHHSSFIFHSIYIHTRV
ncbi:hypothetical protein HanIR_Chr16g0808051 [Helianthus annuus]|nr:hypothetical protein HanIR_Chr16g0808051 [Helianthus annuus]